MEFERYRWQHAKSRLQGVLGPEVVRHWLEDLELMKISPDKVVLGGLLHEVYCYDLRSNHEALLASVLNEFFPELGPFHNKTFEYLTVRSRPEKPVASHQEAQAEFDFPDLALAEPLPDAPSASAPLDKTPKAFPHSLGDFVICEANELAFRAAESVIAQPGKEFSPLMFFGGSGTGKTHLMQGIVNGLQGNDPKARVLYVTGDDFLGEFVQSIRDQQMGHFRKRYREASALLLDDLHLLKGAKQGQAELEQILQHLRHRGVQVVLNARCAPGEIEGLSESLRLKLESGLMIDLSIPALESRERIATRKALERSMDLPPEVARYLARHIDDSLGRLDGALTRLAAQASLLRQPITLSMAQRALSSWIAPTATGSSSSGASGAAPNESELIVQRVCSMFQVSHQDLTSTQRSGRVLRARQAVILLLKELTQLSLSDIGQQIGRNHSTVHNALRKAQQQLEQDQFFRKQLESLRRDLTPTLSESSERLPLFSRASLR
jgi:chromosomal replication initiator protein